MKFRISAAKGLLAILLVLCSSLIVKAGDPPSHSNWDNPMSILNTDGNNPGEGHTDNVCVNLGSDQILKLKLYVDFSSIAIEELPTMKLLYRFYVDVVQVLSGMTPSVTSSMLVAVTDTKGFPRYRATFNIPYNCETYCQENSSTNLYNFDFRLEYQLVKPSSSPIYPSGWQPYPFANYPTVWNPIQFDVSPAPLHSYEHHICCSDNFGNGGGEKVAIGFKTTELATDGGFVQDRNSGQNNGGALLQTPIDLTPQLSVSPNPFSNAIEIKHPLVQPGNVIIECLDLQGRIVVRKTHRQEGSGILDLQFDLTSIPSGLYHLRIRTGNENFMTKIIKTGL
ncbi:MAG: T9SS type A sorting domain-containing protein [Saprospiraceae bacterium]|nr:T9SS type A sorting domain-containing protein [Saprospiraceae bacterium]